MSLTARSEPFEIDPAGAGTDRNPAAATLTDGNVVIAWERYSVGEASIHSRIYAPDGTATGPMTTVSADHPINSNWRGPDVAATRDDHYVLTYLHSVGVEWRAYENDGTFVQAL